MDTIWTQANKKGPTLSRKASLKNMARPTGFEPVTPPSEGKYHAFVLSRLSFDQMDRMLERRMTAAEDLSRMKQAFAELRERVAESKAPVVADDTAAQ